MDIGLAIFAILNILALGGMTWLVIYSLDKDYHDYGVDNEVAQVELEYSEEEMNILLQKEEAMFHEYFDEEV
jgi:hypothetical protein